jgi:hypothetical protein
VDEDRLEVPDALRPAVDALNDAHAHWHDAVDSYHEPEDFRRHVDAAVQSLRNVTWRLQSMKDQFGDDFDAWYGPWQDLMRADPLLVWLNDARIEVVKRSGLNPNSLALVRIIDSYLEPETTLLSLPARTPTDRVVAAAQARIPEAIREHVAIEVLRRWEVAEQDDAELTEVLAHCWHVLDALLVYAAELLRGESPELSPEFVATVEVPKCMNGPNPSGIPLVVEADTLEPFGEEFVRSPRNEADVQRAVDCYGARSLPVPSPEDSLAKRAEKLHVQTRNMFKKDGHAVPVLHLYGRDGAMVVVMTSRDKRDKFLQWHRIGHLVLDRGFDSFVFTSEVWLAPVPDVIVPYPDVENMSGREEALVTNYADSAGNVGNIMSPIVRVLGKPFLKKMGSDAVADVPGEENFVSPVRRAWAMRRWQGSPTPSRRTTAEQHGDGEAAQDPM